MLLENSMFLVRLLLVVHEGQPAFNLMLPPLFLLPAAAGEQQQHWTSGENVETEEEKLMS
jgi:hypothetical protein